MTDKPVDIEEEIQKIKDLNETMVKALVDTDYAFDADELLMARINLLSGIMIELGIVTENDLNIRWELIINGILTEAIAGIEQRAEIIQREINE